VPAFPRFYPPDASDKVLAFNGKVDSCEWPSIAQSGQICLHEQVIRKAAAIVGSALFLVIAPGFVAGLIPWWISHWRFQSAFLGLAPLRVAGGIFIIIGIVGLLDSFRRFAVEGLGTPAPVFPTRHLVITGLYRYVRNPMYVAVVSAILGQALVFWEYEAAGVRRARLAAV
jgi:protein-S-isoprenylcysteine O-methyltransferase Ste14